MWLQQFMLMFELCLTRKSCVDIIFWLRVEIRINCWPRQSHFWSFEAVQSESLGKEDRDALLHFHHFY